MKHGILSKPAVEHISTFVPEHANPSEGAIYAFNQALRRFKRVTVITGAGVSTESGIPDYRSAGVGLYARSDRRPMLYSRFVSSSAARRRYWARNYAGWAAFSSAKPNITHQLLAEWQRRGLVGALVTQNVDGLHGKAGGGPVIELHGSAHRVKCLECDWKDTRSAMQKRLRDCNVAIEADVPELRPDGDVELSEVGAPARQRLAFFVTDFTLFRVAFSISTATDLVPNLSGRRTAKNGLRNLRKTRPR